MTQTYLAFQLEGSEESIFVDATTMHDPSFTSNLTAHPVESGSDITDHARAEPDRVSFEFIISDAPTKGATGGTMNPVESSGRARFSFELLNGLRIKGTLFRVVTAFRSYNNMAIKSLCTYVFVRTWPVSFSSEPNFKRLEWSTLRRSSCVYRNELLRLSLLRTWVTSRVNR
jgi:hypothetical protein